MLFDRRVSSALSERIRVMLWPRRSWPRSVRYIFYRLGRLRSSPHAIALGCACGVFVSFTPFLGLHFIMAGLLSWLTRASIVASAFGTFVGNPITFPFIWMAAYELGKYLSLEEPVLETIDLSAGIYQSSIDQLWSLILPLTLGGVPLGIIAAAIFYFSVKRLVKVYQKRRKRLRAAEPQNQTISV